MSKLRAIGLGTQLRHVLELLDGDVESIYRRDEADYLPRFTPVMRVLFERGALSIKEIAAEVGITHSAASQTVKKMREVNLVTDATTTDQRFRPVTLTGKGKGLEPFLRCRWEATARAAQVLESELDYPLSDLLDQTIALLEQKSFLNRIDEQLRKEGLSPNA